MHFYGIHFKVRYLLTHSFLSVTKRVHAVMGISISLILHHLESI